MATSIPEMFNYNLPGGLYTTTYRDEKKSLVFDPPVYIQRYSTTIRILQDPRWSNHFKKIVDFGCGEMALFEQLRHIPDVRHVVEVDIDDELLLCNKYRVDPRISDYLTKRENPLRVEVLKGSIDTFAENLQNVDAVIAIEVIEHLYADVLENVPKNIFGVIQPKLAIFTTPNCEFNVLFQPLLANGFRHHDHKFEWNRAEFEGWSLNICRQYPNYKVHIMGVGEPPDDHKNVGFVSQIAIFARRDILLEELIEPIAKTSGDDINAVVVKYEVIHALDFPFEEDDRTREEKILHEALYQMGIARRFSYYNNKRNIFEVPISSIMPHITVLNGTEEELRTILRNNEYVVENDFVVLEETEDERNDEFENVGFNDDDDCPELSHYSSEENWD